MEKPNTLHSALIELINKAISSIDDATDFMSAQLPEVIDQALAWHFSYSLISFASAIIVLIIFICIDWKATKYHWY